MKFQDDVGIKTCIWLSFGNSPANHGPQTGMAERILNWGGGLQASS